MQVRIFQIQLAIKFTMSCNYTFVLWEILQASLTMCCYLSTAHKNSQKSIVLLKLPCKVARKLNFYKLCPRSVAICRLRRQHALSILVWLHFFMYLYFQHRSGSTATCRLCRPHTHCNARWWVCIHRPASHWSTLEHTATHYNALQHVSIHWNIWQHTAPHCTTL